MTSNQPLRLIFGLTFAILLQTVCTGDEGSLHPHSVLELRPPQESASPTTISSLKSATSAEASSPKPSHLRPYEISNQQAHDAVQWLVELGMRFLPETHSGDKDWGNQKRVWAGVKFHREGLKLKTNRRWKELNHGRWIKYDLKLPGPGHANRPKAEVIGVSKMPDGRWEIDAKITMAMDYNARIERHNLGVQWWSISVNGKVAVQMRVIATLDFLGDYSELPPAMVLDPKIVSANATLSHFDVDRISKVGGDVAEEFGEVVEKVLRDVWIKKENERLASRLQKSIDKKRDRLRWSATEWFQEL